MNIRRTLFALAAIVSAAAVATGTSSAEIVHVDHDGDIAHVKTHEAPLGSYVEAVVEFDGVQELIDTAPVCSLTQSAVVCLPIMGQKQLIILRSPTGDVCSTYVNGDQWD